MKPTIGRIVYFNDHGTTRPAIVIHVFNDTCLNLEVFGLTESRIQTSVVQDSSETPQPRTWDWMPYQKAKAAEDEQAKILAKVCPDCGDAEEVTLQEIAESVLEVHTGSVSAALEAEFIDQPIADDLRQNLAELGLKD